ncbi:YveK family protein [Nonomuraea sp. NPDC050556]|uniref:YveK family protein n=1 Tax=Nonomuraea sp. NPDC050556 TaxID=3364369 RepID=UPI0037B6A9F3
MSLSPDFGTDLAEHVSLLRRRKLLFLGCVLAFVAGSALLLKVTPPAYTATTQVLVASTGVQDQANQVTGRQREALNLDTEAQVAQSAVVQAKAAELLKTPAPLPAEVTVPPNSSVLWISVTGPDPAVAAAQSRAYAQAYLTNRTETAQQALAAQLKTLLAKLKQVNTSATDVVEEMDKLARGSAERTIATQRLSVLNKQTYSLTMKYDGLKTVAVTPGTVISQATTPTAPSSPSLPLYLGSGLMLGLVAGAAAAYTRDRLDTRLRTAGDVERLTGLFVLADLSGPPDAAAMLDLSSAVVASCPGERLLVRPVPAALGAAGLAELADSAPLSVLDGADVRDLARADAALLLVGLGQASAADVAAAVRHLNRHDVPIIGAVTTKPEQTQKAVETAPLRQVQENT